MNTTQGRPRDERLTERILAATLALLAENGYAQLTIEAVARSAGVSRSTVYKRWPLLADLVLDATLLARKESPAFGITDIEVADTGALESDLLALCEEGNRLLDGLEQAGVLRGLLADSIEHSRIGERLEKELLEPDEERYRGIFERAERRGELDPSAQWQSVPRLLLSFALIQRLVAQRRPSTTEFSRIIGALVNGLRAPH